MEFFIRAYKNYANFNGRDTRQQYWMFFLFYMISYIVILVVDYVLGFGGALGVLFLLGTFLPSIAIITRRLHDIGKSGWWQLVSLVPIVGPIVLIYFLAKEGQKEDNEFGKNPYTQEIVEQSENYINE